MKPWRSQSRIARSSIVAVATLVVATASGVLFERWQESRLTRQHGPPGQMVGIGTHELHLYCEGTGTPPVIMVAGSGLAYSNWSAIQSGLSGDTRVCSYDRSGLGWSQAGPSEPSANGAVDELAVLLSKSGIDGPWIVVGHSLGGLYAQQFMNRHTERVAGLVLLDSTLDNQYEHLPHFIDEAKPTIWESIAPLLSHVGLHRLGRPAVPESDPAWVSWQLHATTKHTRVAAAEWWSIFPSTEQVRASRIPWGDVPLFVFEAGRRVYPDGWSDAEKLGAERVWTERAKELASRSTPGQYRLIEDSGHGIPWEHPDIVISAVRSIMNDLREPQN